MNRLIPNIDGCFSSIEKLRRRCIKDCYWYYVKSKPIISDYEYDLYFNKLKAMEKIEGTVWYSPTQMIWGDNGSQYPIWAKDKNMYHLT